MYVNIKISKAFPEKAFKYAIGKNILEYTEKRNLLTHKRPEIEMKETAQRFGKWMTDKERKTFSLIISPNPDDNPTREQLMEITKAVLDHYFANIQGIIVLHKDKGKDSTKTTPILHSHFYGSVIDPLTGKNLHLSDSDVREIRSWADEYAQKNFGWRPFRRGARNAGRAYKNNLRRAIGSRGNKSWMKTLENIIASEYESAVSFNDFCSKLNAKGIEIVNRGSNPKELQFIVKGVDKTRRVNATTINEQLSWTNLQNKFIELRRCSDDRYERTYKNNSKTEMGRQISGRHSTDTGTGQDSGQGHVRQSRIDYECILCTQDKPICKECSEYHPERGDDSHGCRTR